MHSSAVVPRLKTLFMFCLQLLELERRALFPVRRRQTLFSALPAGEAEETLPLFVRSSRARSLARARPPVCLSFPHAWICAIRPPSLPSRLADG